MRLGLVLTSVLYVSVCLGSGAQAEHGKARVETIANVSAIAPGQAFMLGFKFSIAPGWHIYWKNPGDSGLPTQIKLNLPAGFSAGEILFPVPNRLQLPGDIVNYAYEDQAMFMVRITPPKDLPIGQSIDLNGKVSWLVCQDECIPGKADVSIRLPVADAAKPSNGELFDQWTSRLPVASDPDDITGFSHSLSISNASGKAMIDIHWKKPPANVEFFPGPLKDANASNLLVVSSTNTSKINFDLTNFADNEPVTGLVVFTTAAGRKTGLEISIPNGAGGPVLIPIAN